MIIKRSNIPYSGRSIYGADSKSTVKRLVVSSRGGIGTGGLDVVTPTGTATCQLSLTVSNVYTTELPVTIDIDVIATVDNQRVPTCVDTDNITGARGSMTISVADNGSDHTVISVTLPAGFNTSGILGIPVLVNASVGADLIKVGTDIPTMKDAFEARTSTTRTIDCSWEWNILTLNANGTITRGPVLWKSTMARRFSNGQGPLEQDTLYMDLIKRLGDRNTYKCITSYTQTAGQTWSEVSSNWQVDNSFDIIASGLIMGTDQVIEMRPDNEFLVVDSNNNNVVVINSNGIDAARAMLGTATIETAQARSVTVTDSSDNVVARIGSDGLTVGTASFESATAMGITVTNSLGTVVSTIDSSGDVSTIGTVSAQRVSVGTITATGDITTVGTVSSQRITTGNITATGDITTSGAIQAGRMDVADMTMQSLTLATNNQTYATINSTSGLTVGSVHTNGIDVRNGNNQTVMSVNSSGGITTNGSINSGSWIGCASITAEEVDTTSMRFHDNTFPESYRTVGVIPFNTEIAYITDDETMFDDRGTNWTFNGNDTYVPVEDFPYIAVATSEDVTDENQIVAEQYYFVREEGIWEEGVVPTGVYTSSHHVETTKIYFQLDNQEIFVMGMNFTAPKP